MTRSDAAVLRGVASAIRGGETIEPRWLGDQLENLSKFFLPALRCDYCKRSGLLT